MREMFHPTDDNKYAVIRRSGRTDVYIYLKNMKLKTAFIPDEAAGVLFL